LRFSFTHSLQETALTMMAHVMFKQATAEAAQTGQFALRLPIILFNTADTSL
jgi:hypothetical protein